MPFPVRLMAQCCWPSRSPVDVVLSRLTFVILVNWIRQTRILFTLLVIVRRPRLLSVSDLRGASYRHLVSNLFVLFVRVTVRPPGARNRL